MWRPLISKITTYLMVALAAPSCAILITWNTLPGETLYPLKRGLETVALTLLSPSFKARSSLQAELITRRSDEATRGLIAQSNTQGLSELRAQIQAAKEETINAKNSTAKKEAATRLIEKLNKANQSLEKSKSSLPARQPVMKKPTSSSNTSPSPISQPPTTPTNQVEQTQEEIQEAIEQLEEVKDTKDEDKDRGKSEEKREENEQRKEEHEESKDNKGKDH